MRARPLTLKVLAATTWYVGGTVLAYKGAGYLIEAMGVGATWPPVAAGAAGVLAGLLRGPSLFLEANQRNLRRIDRLPDPRLWQFFRPGFFVALAVMIGFGGFLAWLAEQGYWGGVVVGGAELTVATALWTSSAVFWTGEHGFRSAEAGTPGG